MTMTDLWAFVIITFGILFTLGVFGVVAAFWIKGMVLLFEWLKL